MKMHEDVERVPSFKCSDCDFEFSTMRERNAHVLKDHGKKFVGKPRAKPNQPRYQDEMHLSNQVILQTDLLDIQTKQ